MDLEEGALLLGFDTGVIPDDGSVTSIACRAFYGREGLKSVTIPESVLSIGSDAFACCTSLESVTILGRIARINGGMISLDGSLESIVIPDSVTRIDGSFCGCVSLKKVYFTGTDGQWAAVHIYQSDEAGEDYNLPLRKAEKVYGYDPG